MPVCIQLSTAQLALTPPRFMHSQEILQSRLQGKHASPADLVARLAEAVKLAGQPPTPAAPDAAGGQPAPTQQQQQQQGQQGRDAQQGATNSSSSTAAPAGEGGAAAASTCSEAAADASGSAAGSKKQLPVYLRLLEAQQDWEPPSTLEAQVTLMCSLSPAPKILQGVAAAATAAADESLALASINAGIARAAALCVSDEGGCQVEWNARAGWAGRLLNVHACCSLMGAGSLQAPLLPALFSSTGAAPLTCCPSCTIAALPWPSCLPAGHSLHCRAGGCAGGGAAGAAAAAGGCTPVAAQGGSGVNGLGLSCSSCTNLSVGWVGGTCGWLDGGRWMAGWLDGLAPFWPCTAGLWPWPTCLD